MDASPRDKAGSPEELEELRPIDPEATERAVGGKTGDTGARRHSDRTEGRRNSDRTPGSNTIGSNSIVI
jgi:hypothetical protein